MDTGFIARNIEQLLPTPTSSNSSSVIAAVMYVLLREQNKATDPWIQLNTFRVNRKHVIRSVNLVDKHLHNKIQINIETTDWHAFNVRIADAVHTVIASIDSTNTNNITIAIDGSQHKAVVVQSAHDVHVFQTNSGHHDCFALPSISFGTTEAMSGMSTQ